MDKLLNDREVAAMLGLSAQTLRNWRGLGRGPRYLHPGGRAIRYRLSDVQAFMEQWSVRTDPWATGHRPEGQP